MNFLNPIALFLGALAALIVLMYLLKLRRKREDFSSTLLWMKSVEDLTANAPFQKLRQNLLMYLQILLLLLLAFALARPTMWLSRKHGVSRVILLDNTASMNARDGEKGLTRLEEAKSKVRELIANMDSTDETMIISFGGTAQVAQPFTSEKGTLSSGLNRVEATDAPARIREAVTMAKGVAKGKKSPVITIVGDGGQGYLGNLLSEKDPVEFVAVGSSDANCGIVAFDVRESFERKGDAQVFAEVENFSTDSATVMTRCLINGEVIQAREEKIEGHGKKGFAFAGLKGAARQLLRLELAHDDMLAVDNAVEGFISMNSENKVLLVSTGNFFLERLLGLLPNAKVSKIDPKLFEPAMSDGLVIFDQFAPKQIGPGRYLFINAVPPLEGFSAAPQPVKNVVVLDWNRLHPVTRFLNLNNLAFTESLKMKGPDWVIPLVESEQTPLIFAGERQGVKLVALSFDLYASDWPMQVSFPLFLNNALRWLAGEARGSLTGNHVCGEMITLAAKQPVTITDPTGRSWTCQPDETQQVYFNESYRAGLYKVRKSEGGDEQFAVNLLSREESDITPRKDVVSGEKRVTAISVTRENREIWQWLALAALALLALEWQVYCRRSWL
ncbi:MAG: VWA domain-containing protein [Candidatus Sumerlaeota bacterium]|nr:VWA domain-containing protein [Candidatus Sumerlaeota bacterium]